MPMSYPLATMGAMAICELCNHEMTAADGCTDDPIILSDGSRHEPVRFGSELGWPSERDRCGDCGARRGHVHHHGCDIEECPRCHNQAISCECRIMELDELEEKWDEEEWEERSPY